MYDFRSQLMDKEPRTIILIPYRLEAQVAVISERTVIEPFRCGATRFSNSDGKFPVPSEYLREVYLAQLQPFLQFRCGAEVHWVTCPLRSH